MLFSVFPKRGEFNPEGDDEGAGNSSDGTNDGRKAGKLVSPFETLGLKEEDNPAEKDINKAKIKKVRNQILNLTLPLRV